jgi:hypothetical protein
MKAESDIQQLIQIEAARHGCILMRNNVGALMTADGRNVRFGLNNISKKQNEKSKSSDLIGIRQVVVTPEMVGQVVGIFTAIEVKKEDWKFTPSDKRAVAQKAFIDFVLAHGGVAGFSNNPHELLGTLNRI